MPAILSLPAKKEERETAMEKRTMIEEFHVATCVWSYPDAFERAPSHACREEMIHQSFSLSIQPIHSLDTVNRHEGNSGRDNSRDRGLTVHTSVVILERSEGGRGWR